MKRLPILFLLLFVFISRLAVGQDLPVAKPEDVGLSSERLKNLTDVFQSYADEKKMSGSVVLILRHGKVAYFKSFGKRDVEANSLMTNDAIFRIASQSKALISVGIMILQEEGKLLISDPVGKYIPEFSQTTVAQPKEDGSVDIVRAQRPITLRHLLTHTSGFGYGTGRYVSAKWREAGIQNWYFADRDEPIGETVKRMGALPAESQPGEKFVYGYSLDILGAVIEKVSGMPLDQFLSTRILTPLGMKDTYFYLPQEKVNRFATVYSAIGGRLDRAPDSGTMTSQGMYVNGPRKSFSGGAGLLSTASDYARFLQMMLNGGTLNGKRILSPKTVELMTVSHIGNVDYAAGRGFGLGFEVITNLGEFGAPGSVGAYGWGGAYGSKYWVDPKEDMVVVYMKQLIPTGGLDDQDKLRTLVYQAVVK